MDMAHLYQNKYSYPECVLSEYNLWQLTEKKIAEDSN